MTIAKIKWLAWDLLTFCILGVIYWTVISEGLRLLMPVLGQRLHKVSLPGFSYFDRFEATYKLDLAHGMAVFLFIAMWNLWGMILKAKLGSDAHFQESGWNPQAYKSVVMLLGKVILGADLILFYVAMTQMGWSGSAFSFPALIATPAYVGILLFVKLKSVNLESQALKESLCHRPPSVTPSVYPVGQPSAFASDGLPVNRAVNSAARSTLPHSKP